MTTRFVKLHGLGNDFLLIDARAGGRNVTPDEGRALCDRNRGVGGDGVLWLGPPKGAGVTELIITNADGSLAEMCGNGIRCVAKYLADEGGVRADVIPVETGAGLLECEVQRGARGVETVRVKMGKPRLQRAEIPMLGGEGRFVEDTLSVDGETLRFTAVSMGNPHAITFEGADLQRARSVGPKVEHHALFPARTNVEFASVRSREELDLVVWERGCGVTQACGTGACATTVAAVLTERVDAGREVRVNLPGGPLYILVPADLSQVYMRGPAERVFDGTLALDLGIH